MTYIRAGEVVRLAKLTIDAAMEDDVPMVGILLRQIADDHGGPGCRVALGALCDMYLQRALGRVPNRERRIRFAFLITVAGGFQHAAGEPAGDFVWATRLVAARAALDRSAYERLVDALPVDPKALNRHIYALVEAVAMQFRFPAGYAAMVGAA